MRVLVKDIMTRGVIKLDKNSTLQEVAKLFAERMIDGAPVVENKKVAGVLTKTHLLRAMAQGLALDTPIEALMSRNVITINQMMPAEEAMAIPVGRLPVVNDRGELVGWLTRTDLANAFSEKYKFFTQDLIAVLDSLPYALVAVDREGRITTINRAACELCGVEAEDALEQPVQEVFDCPDLLKVARNGIALYNQKLQINNRPVLANYFPVLAEEKLIGAVALLHNL